MKKSVRDLVLSALFIAIGMVLPFLTGQIPQIGKMLSPMHLPVLLCGLICGWQYGAVVGFVLPLLRSLIFGMPPLYPEALAMAFELCTYGLVIGLLYRVFRKKGVLGVYCSLIPAMLAGRAVWGIAKLIFMGLGGGDAFTWQMFLAGAFVNAVPAIILQLVLVPVIMVVLDKTGLVKFSDKQ